jgi:hypothetical protein
MLVAEAAREIQCLTWLEYPNRGTEVMRLERLD